MSNVIKFHTHAFRVRVVQSQRPVQQFSGTRVNAEGIVRSDAEKSEEAEYRSVRKDMIADPELLQQEYDQGFAEGMRVAEERLRQEHEQKLNDERLRTGMLLANVQKQLDTLEQKSERTVVHLAVAIAEQIVKREITLDREMVLRQIREALRRVMGVGHVRLRVNPIDEQMVRDHRAAMMGSSDSIREIVVESDEHIPPGGCILESDSGNVDARLATQLKKIEAALSDEGSL
ncbi:MAG: FliH/SctL family protein [Ignavibacteria bacterium]|nr:FliH/SctL family protein [Ignavibacteria bacterium]